MTTLFTRLLENESGQDLVEYVLLTATIGLCSVVAMNVLSGAINLVYTTWNTGTQSIWQPENPK